MQHEDGSYDYLGLDKDGNAHLTTIHSCGAPTQVGSRTPSGMAGISGAAASAWGSVQALVHRLSDSSPLTFASRLETVSTTQHEDGSYDYLGLDKNGNAHLTTIHSCGPPTQGGSRTRSSMAGISGAAASAQGRVRAVDDRLSTSSPLASPVAALADASATLIKGGAYACLELPPNGEAPLSAMQSPDPSALGGLRAATRTAVPPSKPAASRSLPPLDAHLADIQEASETGVSVNADLGNARARNEQASAPTSSDVFLSHPAMMLTPIVRRTPLQTAWQGAAWKYTLYSDKSSVHKSTERKRGRRGGVNNKNTPPPSTRLSPRTTPEAAHYGSGRFRPPDLAGGDGGGTSGDRGRHSPGQHSFRPPRG